MDERKQKLKELLLATAKMIEGLDANNMPVEAQHQVIAAIASDVIVEAFDILKG